MNKVESEHELEILLSGAECPKKTLDLLETAQWHYMDLVHITDSGLLTGTELDKEREEYSHIIRSEDGLPVFDEKECAIYMSEKHNLPLPLCMAYVQSEKW